MTTPWYMVCSQVIVHACSLPAHHVRRESAVAPGLLDVLLVLHLDPGVGRVGALAVLGDVVAARLRLRVHAQHPRRPQRPEHDQRAPAAPTEDRQDPQAVDTCGGENEYICAELVECKRSALSRSSASEQLIRQLVNASDDMPIEKVLQ